MTYQILQKVPLPGSGTGIAFAPDGRHAYVCNSAGSVSVIDTATYAVTATIAVGPNLRDIAMSPSGSSAYVVFETDDGGALSVIDTATNTASPAAALPARPATVLVHPDGTRLFLSCFDDNTVRVIDIATRVNIATIQFTYADRYLALSPSGDELYVGHDEDNVVSVVNTTIYAVTSTIAVGDEPAGIAVSSSNTRVYVGSIGLNTNRNAGPLNAFDVGNHARIWSIQFSPPALTIALNPKATFLYAGGKNVFTVVDAGAGKIVGTVQTGGWIMDLAVQPGAELVYLTNYEQDYVSVIGWRPDSDHNPWPDLGRLLETVWAWVLRPTRFIRPPRPTTWL
ncbi:cytochrome D1 domain-containing protein [Mycolicibacterium sp. 050232]|uniref:cytochrome D1 domain-containing protein n=1 Tax=Mycolicibacterium sp. 050232 TaxID=3113982 RepID=UPI002E2E603E|nr:cytochrome D1 domain-containing protein [Mycolicibacterium sp. 050232]MED5814598.1 cytochrome D1 domain-containing protein [Mycolicibacterium sp. 050232]